MVKKKKTLLSPTASLMHQRSQLWGKITTVQSLKIRHLKRLNKLQDLVIGEHVKSKAAMKKVSNANKEQFNKLKTRYSKDEMEQALKAAREQRDKAMVQAATAEELIKKNKMEF